MKSNDYLILLERTNSFLCQHSQIIEKSPEPNFVYKDSLLDKIRLTIDEINGLKAIILKNDRDSIFEAIPYSKENRIFTGPTIKMDLDKIDKFIDRFFEEVIRTHDVLEKLREEKLIQYASQRMNSVKTDEMKDAEGAILLRLVGITLADNKDIHNRSEVSEFEAGDFLSKERLKVEDKINSSTIYVGFFDKAEVDQIQEKCFLNNDTTDALEPKLEEGTQITTEEIKESVKEAFDALDKPVVLSHEGMDPTFIPLLEAKTEETHTENPPVVE